MFLSSQYACEMPASAGYRIRSVNGVFHLYESDEALERDEPLNYTYTSFKKYIVDVMKMCDMISNGPL